MKIKWPSKIVFIDYDQSPPYGSFERSVFVTECDLDATLTEFAINDIEVIDIVPPSTQSIKEILIEHKYENNLLKEAVKASQKDYLAIINHWERRYNTI